MSKVLSVLLLLILVAVILLGGGVAGVLYQRQQPCPQAEKANALIKTLSSKVIPSIVAYGQVTAINGRNLTIDYAGETLTTNIKATANIIAFTGQGTSAVQKQGTFADIKKGDNVNINLKLSPEGELSGESVVIIPVFKTSSK